MQVQFVVEKETKGTRRYKEVGDDPATHAIGVLYVKKSALAKLGNPDKLTVTVEATP